MLGEQHKELVVQVERLVELTELVVLVRMQRQVLEFAEVV